LIGSMAVTFATVAPGGLQITIIGDKGKIIVDDDRIDLVSGNERRTIPYGRIHDVQAELVAFVASVRHGASHRNPPEEALQDVAIILALLRSAETGRVTEVERV